MFYRRSTDYSSFLEIQTKLLQKSFFDVIHIFVSQGIVHNTGVKIFP